MNTTHFGCIRCPEPATSLKHGKHVFFSATAVYCGAKVRLVVNCTVCGYVNDLTEHIKQVSERRIEELLNSKKVE